MSNTDDLLKESVELNLRKFEFLYPGKLTRIRDILLLQKKVYRQGFKIWIAAIPHSNTNTKNLFGKVL